ncbi:Stk1 family PASTA domain-containing Ser/Thr kinase [Solicola gregarius]|uniref:non-specific serine/threonine protein kinase n=1 Tax=Solicola gregarius TaxID=2908642 RepID=A0AA46YLX4_9ACTN|nr:Stk1 family PASTA domain-containing Ser/Thr kinase [Solicola gregarius]UYM07410.1 Stk1 family PASTA domain-containing Ser/Thr kinase [Solicola gregarius]
MTEPPQGPPMGADQVGRLGDRYEVGGLLGRGGMADVRVGRDLRLGRTVAIKRLRNDLASDPTFQARFRREAQSAASLNHPSIVAVYDTGEEIGPDGQGVPFIVMELVEGQTLREVLRQDRKILPQRALDITADILGALDYSHRAGIVHRDIKPANVMLTPSGQVKVMDFGIARAIADSSSAMTQTAAVVGTAQYLSPEQARGEQVDARSDIYSTGCLLFELLTGRPPFVGDSPVSVAYQHVREEPPAPSQFNPEVTPAMDAVVLKALTKRTEDRYQSAAEMRADIERVLAGLDVAGPTVTTPVAAMPMTQQQDATSTIPAAVPPPQEPYEEQRKRRKWPWILVILLVLAIIGGAAYALRDELNGGGGSEGPTTTTVPTGMQGQPLKVATNKLENADLEVGNTPREYSDEFDKGQVITSDPGEGEEIDEGEQVDLTISKGEKKIAMPTGLTGKPVDEVVQEINDAGFPNVTPKRQTESSLDPDLVIKIVPGGKGADLAPDTQITVYYSAGYDRIPPGLVGRKIDPALRILDRQGFDPDNVEVTDDPESTEEAGVITAVDPAPGSYVDPEEPLSIMVSTGENAEEDDSGNEGNGNGNGNEGNGNDDGSEPPSNGGTTQRGLPGEWPFGLID